MQRRCRRRRRGMRERVLYRVYPLICSHCKCIAIGDREKLNENNIGEATITGIVVVVCDSDWIPGCVLLLLLLCLVVFVVTALDKYDLRR